jgi:hypothetical protein
MGKGHRPETYRTSPNEVTSGPALLAFSHKGFAETLDVTLFGEPL